MNLAERIENEYWEFLTEKEFPCVAAKAALSRNHVSTFVAGHMGCPSHDKEILKFLYAFVDRYGNATELYHSVAIIFPEPRDIPEHAFDQLLWQRLKSLSEMDKAEYEHDPRVDSDPRASNYSFSLKEEAFYIIGLHPASSRRARRFKYPALIFNPHAEFEKLRKANRYNTMKAVVRKRDVAYSGSVNPALSDFGDKSEVFQYSGVEYPRDWTCPLLD